MKSRDPIDTVAIEKRNGPVAEVGGAIDYRFGQRCALKKTESGRGVELDVGRRHNDTLATTVDTEDREVKTV